MDKPETQGTEGRAPLDEETGTVSLVSDLIDCPLCAGKGQLSRTFLYDQLGVRDMAKLATHTAKEAVSELTDKLWGKYKENLDRHVSAKAETLNQDIERLKTAQSELLARNKALAESIAEKEQAARDAQKNDDKEESLAERQKLQDEVADLKGQLEQAYAKTEAAEKQRAVDVQAALAELKQSQEPQFDDLKSRIEKMNDELLAERTEKARLQTKLERTESEVKQREHEAKSAAVEEKQEELDNKQSQIDQLKDELAELKATVKSFPEQERLAKQAAIQDQEGKLRKLELDRDNLRTERDKLKDDLTEAQRKLEDTKGKVEERTFEEMASGLPGIWIENWSSKKKSGDYHVGLFDKDGEKLIASKIVVDNKDVGRLTDDEINKLVRDAEHQQVAVAAMVVKDEAALRPKDRDARFAPIGGVTVLRTTRDWFQRDIDLLRPLMRRQAEEGPNFLRRNIAVAVEVRAHMKSLDNMEKFMRLARENAERAEKEIRSYRGTMEDICRSVGEKTPDAAEEE